MTRNSSTSDSLSNDYTAHLVKSQSYAQSVEILVNLTILIGAANAKKLSSWLDESRLSDPLKALRDLTLYELIDEVKISVTKAEIVLAGLRLGKVAWLPPVPTLAYIHGIDDSAQLFYKELAHLDFERIMIACMNSQNMVLSTETIGIGTSNSCSCDPKAIFKTLLKQGATRWIIAHNHPSGYSTPSPEDLELTEKLLKASVNMSLPLLDHIIIGNGSHTSLRSSTSLWDRFPQND